MNKITNFIVIVSVLFGLSSCNTVVSLNSKDTSKFNPRPDSQSQKIIKIGGSSSTKFVLELLAKAYQAKDQTIKIEFISNSQSEGAIASLKNDIIDIAGSSHKLNPKEDNGQIQYREIAQDLLVVATHSSVKGVSNLSTQQLKAIYRGEITNWQKLGGSNGKIILLDRPEDESAKKLLRKYYLGEEKTTSKAVILNKEGELIATLQSTPNSIGAFSLAYSLVNKLPVNYLSLNGVAPKAEKLTTSQYKMVRHIGIVWDKTPSKYTQDFIDFIFSQEGNKILEKNGFVPAK
ncbi:substrate-binding domain-containing protein [Nostoc sp. UHCC 0870]|uniref:substrate-binding domain-containing protein n=1 Tax=Nostoc sp. UHCC 0870 TaxID=2914041 RepID=UPI001EE0EC12|nr:substrate-binding domain-containing protein [Nostoc sp. UHCC 0870]UKO98612.1 substrate-binding domain-containing protein [Nostoc sp. UHCC 0870]